VRGFLQLLSRLGTRTVARGAYESTVSAEAQRALEAEGIVRPGPLARTFPCGGDEPGCAREVRGFDDDDDLGLEAGEPRVIRDRTAPRTYVAVCTQSPHACPFVDVASDALLQVAIARDPLVRTLARLLGLAAVPRAPHAIHPAADDEPLLLGEEMRDGTARDVALLVHPRRDLASRVAARERDSRPATIFVPTSLGVDPALFTQHGAGAHVELGRLDDVIAVRGGVLVAVPRLRVLRGESTPARAQKKKSAAPLERLPVGVRPLPPLERWGDLRICKVDGETVLLTLYGVSSRRMYVDMGMAAKNNRKPVKAWRVLMAILEEEGRFTWSGFGNYLAAAKAVSDLRALLQRALGTDLDPFEPLPDGEGWRPRFVAKRDPPKDKMPGRGKKN
jgi:hypothetical protein